MKDRSLPPAEIIPVDVPVPLGNYRAVVVNAGMGFVSGQFPIRNGDLVHAGRVTHLPRNAPVELLLTFSIDTKGQAAP